MEHDLREDQTRAQRAAAILNNEVFAEVSRSMRDEIVKAWVACPVRDDEGKQELWRLIKTLDKFEGLLKGYIETGKLATEQLKRFEKESVLQRLKRIA
jgi:uncharacterized lipoprotein YmbA